MNSEILGLIFIAGMMFGLPLLILVGFAFFRFIFEEIIGIETVDKWCDWLIR